MPNYYPIGIVTKKKIGKYSRRFYSSFASLSREFLKSVSDK